MLGVSRLLRGYSLISPASNFKLSANDEKESRRRCMTKALDMLSKPGQKRHHEAVF